MPTTDQSNKTYTMAELIDLWNRLSDVPVDDDGIEEPFLHFPIFTPCESIWHWFEGQHPDFHVGAAGQRIGADHPFRKIA